MRFNFPSVKLIAIAILAFAFPAFASHVHHGPTAGHRKSAAHRVRGQRSIDTERATEIQTALIREHYLDGEPTGQWDAATESAMQRYQAAHGWQTKLMPDSRALISLGLGPDHSQDAFQTVPVSGTRSSTASSGDLAGAFRSQSQ